MGVFLSSKVLIIIATGEKEKALAGLMYPNNALKYSWLEDLKVILLGPSEKLIVQEEQVWTEVKRLNEMIGTIACKAISGEYKTSSELEKRCVRVEYVGKIMSDLIKDGYSPMI